MDPTACLELILDNLKCGDRLDAIESLEDLREWLIDDGFMPDVERAVLHTWPNVRFE